MKKEEKNDLVIYIILSVALVIIIALGVYFGFIKKDNTDNPQVPQTPVDDVVEMNDNNIPVGRDDELKYEDLINSGNSEYADLTEEEFNKIKESYDKKFKLINYCSTYCGGEGTIQDEYCICKNGDKYDCDGNLIK